MTFLMKTLLVLFLMLPNLAMADEEVGNTLDSLHFRPFQATFEGRLDFTPDIFYRSYSPAGDPSTFGTHARFPVDAGVTYGLTDFFSVGISEGFLFHSTFQNEHENGTITNGSAGGFSDPTLSANYRYVGTLNGTFFADAFANVSPSVGMARTTGFPGAGNDLRGASTYQLGTTAYSVHGSQEVSLGISGTFETGVNSTGGTPQNTATHDSFFSFALAGQYRYHFDEKIFAQVGATFNLVHTVNSTFANQSPVRTDTTHFPCDVIPRIEGGYLITTKWLAVTGLDYTEYTSSDTANRGGAVTNTKVEIKAIGVDVGIRFIL